MKIIRLFFNLGFLLFLFTACEKNEVNLPESNLLEGEWTLREVTGGIHGQGYAASFDLMKLENGSYSLTKGMDLRSKGAYTYRPETENGLSFSQEQHAEDFFEFVDQPKTVVLMGKDSLLLTDPCCDLFAYLFLRKSSFP